MRKIRRYSLREGVFIKRVSTKLIWFFVIFSLIGLFFQSSNLYTDVLNNVSSWKISSDELYKKSSDLPNSKVEWPVKQVVDLSYKSLQKYWISYEQYKKTPWSKIPQWMKRQFPQKIGAYINKYKFLNLRTCRDYFSNPDDLNYFTFMRRVVRTIWTASYSTDKIWIKWSWTHAGVDIISAVWTPVYSIATWLVVEVKHSNKWFGNFAGILYKVNWKYYEVFFWHMNKVLVSVWQIVWLWQQIWEVWDSWNSTTSHLHFQVNKVFTLQDIVSGKVMMWWYHDIRWVEAYTVDPISFVEDNFYKEWDNLPLLKQQEEKEVKTETVKNDDMDLVKALSDDLAKTTKKIKKSTYIKNISLSLLDNKVQVWHGFTIKLVVATWAGQIAIKPSNPNLQFSPDLIKNPDKSTYLINVLALNPWNTQLTFTDGKTIRNYNIEVYTNTDSNIFSITANITWLNLLKPSKLSVSPVDKFWRKLNKPLKGLFKIYFQKWNNKKLVKTIAVNWDFVTYLTWCFLWKSKLIIESDKFTLKQNVITNLAKDYSYNWEYSKDLSYLVKKWVVKWDNGFLKGKSLLSRRALVIIIWRSVLHVNYDEAKKEMLTYLKTKWKFFKDIDGSSYADPYIFEAWKKWITKWYNWYSLANTNVSKWELLTIFTRLFKISVVADPLNVWKDLSWWELKAVADTVKRYNLFPFSDLTYFNAGEKVSRLVAFETLYRFMTFKPSFETEHLSAPVSNTSSTKEKTNEQLQQAMKDIFDF